MQYWKITIELRRNDLEPLTGALVAAGFDTFEIQDPRDAEEVLRKEHDYDYDVADESLLAADPDGDPKIVLYLEDEPDGTPHEAGRLHALEGAVFAFKSVSVIKERVDDSLWKNAYKEHFSITEMADRLVVVPSWEEDRYEREKDTVYKGLRPVFMDPGTAFGTGDHPTTSMCAAMMAENGCEGKAVLDVGTGSGILAIGAAALGARPVLGVEIDPEAVIVAKENVKKNGCEEAVEIREGDLLNGVDFRADLVVANLFAEIIVRLIPAIRSHLNEDGLFISTGILEERCEKVLTALEENGFAIREVRKTGEWCAVAAAPVPEPDTCGGESIQ